MAGTRRSKNAIHIAKKMSRKGYADEGYVDPNDPDNQPYYDPMGGVYGTVPNAQSPDWYNKTADVIAKTGQVFGSPVVSGLRGAGESMNRSIYGQPLGYTEKEKADFPAFTEATEEYYKPVQQFGRVLMSPFAGAVGGAGEFVREGAEQLGAEPNLARQLGREASGMTEWSMMRGDMIKPQAPRDVSAIPRSGELLPPDRVAVTREPVTPPVTENVPYRVISGEVTLAEPPRDTARVTAEPMRQLEAPRQAEEPQYARDAAGDVINRPDMNLAFEEDARPIPQERTFEDIFRDLQRINNGLPQKNVMRSPEIERQPAPTEQPIFRDNMTLPQYEEAYVLKPRGGNWESDVISAIHKSIPVPKDYESLSASPGWLGSSLQETNLDKSLNALKHDAGLTPTRIAPELQGVGLEDAIPALPENQIALGRWVDTKLRKYITSEMGTAFDPVHDLAERGIFHYPTTTMLESPYRSDLFNKTRGSNTLAQDWDYASKGHIVSVNPSSFKTYRYGSDWVDVKQNAPDWVKNFTPDTRLYDLQNRRSLQHLGFNHILDELVNATSKDSDLPQNLRLDPSKLDRVTVPQAVQLVDKINKWRAEAAKKAKFEAANNAAVKPIKEYPNGNKWVEISLPDDPNMTPAQKTSILDKALKYEGESMGHCVGGYCSKVENKRSQIYSLRDAKGEPHVTIETAPVHDSLSLSEEQGIDMEAAKRADAYATEQGFDDLTDYRRWKEFYFDQASKIRNEILDEKRRASNDQRIIQIKGKGNRKPADKYLPMVQDFVRSREWTEINDLANADLYHHSEIADFIPKSFDVPKNQRILALDKAREEGVLPTYSTRDEWEEILKRYLPEGSWTPRKSGGRIKYEDGDWIGRRHFALGGFGSDDSYVEPEYKPYTPLFPEDSYPEQTPPAEAQREEPSYPMGRREDPAAPVREGAVERATYEPLRYVTPRSSNVGDTALSAIGKSRVMPYEGDGPIAGDLSRGSIHATANRPLVNPAALIVHHTAGRGTPEGVMNALNQQGFSVHYVVDRDGKIYATLPNNIYGIHTGASAIPGINNATTYGVEVIANDDRDILPAQVEAVRNLYGHLQKSNPKLALYGHGEIASHKQADEGKTIVSAIRGGDFTPARQVLAQVPLAKRTLRSYGTGEFKSGGKVYPVRNHTDWEEAHDYEKHGGKLTHMSPDKYLSRVKPLNMDHDDKKIIHHFKKQMEKGEKFDPLAIEKDGHPNGRHRAHAAKKLGIKSVPVMTWPKKAEGGAIVDRALMLMSSKAKRRRGRPDNS